MKLDPILTRASRLARAGKHGAAIRVLEPEVNRYHGSFHYYYLLGVCCLHISDFGGALTWFRLAHDAKIRDPLARLGIAALYLRRGETDKAVDYYLEVLESDPKNRIAKKALAVIRRYAGADTFSAWLESGRLSALYPPVPAADISATEILLPIAALLAAGGIACGVLIRFRLLPNPFAPRGSRPGTEQTALTGAERAEPMQTGGSYRYILTISQALDEYEQALSLFTAYRDEAAKIKLNRILESNASEGLKNKSRIIISHMEAPGFDTFKRGDNVPYAEVIKDPALYRGVYVIWQGMATNVAAAENGVTFDFLVGYDTRTPLEGIAPVVFDRVVPINIERPLEVLGRIAPLGEAAVRLEGAAIHQSGKLQTDG
jgi:tetratricopeptide (TPR) repeat protein